MSLPPKNFLRTHLLLQDELRNNLVRLLSLLEAPGDPNEAEKQKAMEQAASVIERTADSAWIKSMVNTGLPDTHVLLKPPKLAATGHGWIVYGALTPEDSDGYLALQSVRGQELDFGSALILPFRIRLDRTQSNYSASLEDIAEVVVDLASVVLELNGIDNQFVPLNVHFGFREDTKHFHEIQQLLNCAALRQSSVVQVVDMVMRRNPDLKI